ncbi:hypothetical protein L208DRAFT_25815 [Tricholoma matsutake]|nr:hypothetical protein L208DRAFT_25815 [Tricholoma matsutake 945]
MLYPQSFTYFSSNTGLNPQKVNLSSLNIQTSTSATDIIPYPIFILTCSSLCISTMALVFSAVILNISSLLYIFIPVFALTILYHIVVAITSRTEVPDSPRLFSRANVISVCALSVLWTAATGIAVAVNVLIGMGRLNTGKGSWNAIIPCICSFLEVIIMGFIAFLTQKERKRILYSDKWKWRAGQDSATSSASQWSVAK